MNSVNFSNSNNFNFAYRNLNNNVGYMDNINEHQQTNKPDKGNGFAAILEKSIDALNNEQLVSEHHKRDIATGKVEDLQKAIIDIDRAGLSISLAGEVKNKILAAYKEIMNTQV